MNEVDIKKVCFDCEFYSFGTIRVFEKRQSYYGTWLKRITFLGLLSPVVLGGFVAAFSTESEVLKYILLPLLKWYIKFGHYIIGFAISRLIC
ncbi:hypothetical protein [Photobacterium iliopiscarium]|uniref:hypothetical protein n=1 Tax=Photobacterium iliopiscarium TaxID=56192 RepID=UPI0005D2EAFC|nr:hypothetical protein [Photobacterium iliopiscarium]KJG14547.1 hypothetical protein UB38_02850 [Photobacterium iliopiscarium]PST99301.1 hypothetical protein C9I85_12215 [Photobacterium iliopiscarium]PSV84925.1 hypothetical protein C9J51_01195 [Photobacterium iliopiscarium]USN27424.1 hypothetical protein [synthetic construct]